MRWLVLSLFLFCSLRVEAGLASSPSPGIAVAAAPTNTDFGIDLWPDTQNQANPGTIAGLDGVTPSETDCSTFYECTGDACVHAPDCGTDWNSEGKKVLAAQLAVVTGQNAGERRRPALVLQLGDLADSYDMSNQKRRDDPCSSPTLNASQLSEWTTIRDYILTLMRSIGIPVGYVHGNHDALGCYEQMIAAALSGMPYVHGSTVDAVNQDASTIWAIKAPTRVGSLCAITSGFDFYAETRDAALTLVGCGAALPTIIAHHAAINDSCDHTYFAVWNRLAAGDDLTDRADHPEIFALAAAHTTPESGFSCKTSYTGADSGQTIFIMKQNWQELKHRNFGSGFGKGVTPANGGDGMLTRVLVSPSRKFLHSYDYNAVLDRKGGYGPVSATELYASFDYCARFGGC